MITVSSLAPMSNEVTAVKFILYAGCSAVGFHAKADKAESSVPANDAGA
jgi:hypothetical protein